MQLQEQEKVFFAEEVKKSKQIPSVTTTIDSIFGLQMFQLVLEKYTFSMLFSLVCLTYNQRTK